MKHPMTLAPVLVLALLLSACATEEKQTPVAGTPPAELVIEQSWSGDYPVAELKRLPEGQQKSGVGYLGNTMAFESVWTAFKPGEAVPAVDFHKQVVVFQRNVAFYNHSRIFKITLKEGVADVMATETMSAIPIADKVAMAMAVIPRSNVKVIQAGLARVPLSAE